MTAVLEPKRLSLDGKQNVIIPLLFLAAILGVGAARIMRVQRDNDRAVAALRARGVPCRQVDYWAGGPRSAMRCANGQSFSWSR